MDPVLSPAQSAFRSQVADVLAPVDPVATDDRGVLLAYRALAERGWLAPHWPQELGGAGATEIETALVHELLVERGVPDLDFAVSIAYAGSCLLSAGTDEQRRVHLPAVARGDTRLAICFTESDAGSDLAALRCRAEREGDGFVLYGRKLYSQTADRADLALVAARVSDASTPAPLDTRGITLFLVCLDDANVLRRRSANLTRVDFTEVVFDGVRLAAGAVIGEVGEGWSTITTALALERIGFEQYVHLRKWFAACARRARADGQTHDRALTDRLTELAVRLDAAGAMTWRLVREQAEGKGVDTVAAAAAKWWVTELARPVAELALDVAGHDALPNRLAPDDAFGSAYREAPGMTLSGGASEIMLLTIATAGLGLR
jgi:alkylation response protein AidB-like acyl-CoA dehydrogenase